MFTRVGRQAQRELGDDVLDALADELELVGQALTAQVERLAAIVELQRSAAAATARLKRPVSIFDLIDLARDEREREHLAALAGRLRRRDESAGTSRFSRRYEQ